MDQASGTEIASFPIYKVLFCARGKDGTLEADCFSFTESYRSSEDFQIHIFSCHIKEAVSLSVWLFYYILFGFISFLFHLIFSRVSLFNFLFYL